jgi:23S rRNA pseudouridine1911/1915/1917 synthase
MNTHNLRKQNMEIKMTAADSGKSVLEYLLKNMKLSTRSLRRLKYTEGGITVNGESVTVRCVLREGDVLRLDVGDRESSENVIPRHISVDMLFEDGEIIAVDKPANMPTHPSHGHLDDTLANALAFKAATRGERFVFRPANRLDRNTSGIVLVAKDQISACRLFEQMRAGNVKKTYIAILDGVPSVTRGTVDAPIARADEGVLMRTVSNDGREAHTEYNVVAVSPDGKYSLVVLRPLTGRTHQLRVHMAHIGCPILGDFLYGNESPLLARHALHAARLEFDHPADGRRMRISAPLPDDMAALCEMIFEERN